MDTDSDIADLRAKLKTARDALRSIAEHTDPDAAENYRADDREGCLDATHSIARTAYDATEGEARSLPSPAEKELNHG